MMGYRLGKHERGQSTLEYILVLAAVLLALIAGATQLIQPAANATLAQSQNTIEKAANKLTNGLRGL